jgi:hypothetical protein
MNYLAHAEEVANEGFIDKLTDLPVWVSLLLIAFVLFGVYVLLEKLHTRPINRVIAMVPLLILIAILYMEHNPTVTTVVLSLGFVATFLLAFALLTGGKKEKDKNSDDHAGKD